MVNKIIEILTNTNKKNYTIEELAKKINSSEDEVKKIIKDLQKKDKVVKHGKDKYRFNDFYPDEEEQYEFKQIVLTTIKEKKFCTLRDLKNALKFRKPEQIIFLHNLLIELENKNEIYHSQGRGFYSLEKINYFSEKHLKEHILKILSRYPYVSIKRLKKELHFTKEDNEDLLIEILKKLEQAGILYSKNKMYQKMPNNFKIATIVEVWGGG